MTTSLLAWAKRNERWLSSLFFLSGFVGDVIAFTLLEVTIVNLIFAVYLVMGGAAILVAHYLFSHPAEHVGRLRQALLILLPLFVQYAVGAILSGSLIFYTKSATLEVSWPFLALLAVVFFGNEYFRGYREHLSFQTMLFFFGLYAYSIFALPLVLGQLGPLVFLGSSIVAMVVLLCFLYALYRVGENRFKKSFKVMLAGSIGILLLINGAYFTGLIPPLPLGLKDAAVYHLVERVPQGYRVLAEGQKDWWEFYEPTTIHHVGGTPLYAYTAVFAPVRFTATVVHEWERLDETQRKWVSMNRVSFPVSGGRMEGYRGYSVKTDPSAGRWRVSIKTGQGQTIGRFSFIVETVPTAPPLTESIR